MKVGRKRGGHIAAVLLTAVVALSLLFTVAAGAVSHLRFTAHSSNSQRARNLADAAIETAIASLRQDLRFGQTSGLLASMPAGEIRVSEGEAHGTLSFHPQHAAELGIPVSLNNVESDAPRPGWNDRVVPSEAVQLVAVGECGGVKKTVEAVLHVPRFPYIIACSGPFHCEGPLTLGVVPRSVDPQEVTADQLLPGHLVSNSPTTPAIELKGETVISGDVEAVGGISTVAPATVRGHTKPASSEVPLARLDVADYDPLGKYAMVDTFLGATESTILSGYSRSPGDIRIEGDLSLEAGVLYVDGSVEVMGGVKGKGALLATEGITIHAASNLDADQQVALVSRGNVTLNGSGSFRGLIYTEGNLSSRGVQLIGALVTNGPEEAGKITLVESGMVAGEPNMNFNEGWLCESTVAVEYDQSTVGELQNAQDPGLQQAINEGMSVQLPSGQTIQPPASGAGPRMEVQGRYLREEDGLVVVEWTYDLQSALGDVVNNDPIRLLSREYRILDFYNSDGQRVRTESPMGALISANGEIITLNTPPAIKPVRVEKYSEMQDFELDFSEFLRPEEDLRMLLRVEH